MGLIFLLLMGETLIIHWLRGEPDKREKIKRKGQNSLWHKCEDRRLEEHTDRCSFWEVEGQTNEEASMFTETHREDKEA